MLIDDTTLTRLLQPIVGHRCAVVSDQMLLTRDDYAVIRVTLAPPAMEVVVKLAGPRAPIACPFDRTAAIIRLVSAHTAVPTCDVLAADTSYRDWPWRYMVLTAIHGETWATLRPRLDSSTVRDMSRQLGRAVSQLHAISFPGWGEIEPDGLVHAGTPYLTALAERARRRIGDPRHAALFVSALADRAHLFEDMPPATLCHEDLNPNNILFQQTKGGWRLAALLDFDSAWAGNPESDLARLDLWYDATAADLRHAYAAIRPISAGYAQRRPLYQLLWCLEYASPTQRHNGDTARLCAALGLPPVHFG